MLNVGIIGYGHLGKFLSEQLSKIDGYCVKVIWNRNIQSGDEFQSIIRPLDDITPSYLSGIDLVVEVAHPSVIKKYGAAILEECNLFIGSPTALADADTHDTIAKLTTKYGRSVFVPAGAFWGGEDVQKMADQDILSAVTVTMIKHPLSFRLESPLKEKNDEAHGRNECVVLYEGPVRQLCALAPNNVNTMAGAAVAAHTLGFDNVKARLISDPAQSEHHIVTVEVFGKGGFHCLTTRTNPAGIGKVTGSATYFSFLSSIKAARNKPSGIQIC
uniref:Aspartate dehydrogenase domain-containing protein n=1 Tax=Plectus sambesii TaxID=2011161 RepID=A0A914XSE3_9BILA